MGYELLVETSDGVWKSADIGDASAPMVFQLNDISQLENRQASYSQQVVLPITPTNCEIFDYVEDFNTLSDTPYVLRRCQLKHDGITIVSTNYRLELLSITNTFNCVIVNNILDLVSALKNSPMSELGLERIEWTTTNIRQANLGNRYYMMPRTFVSSVDGALRFANWSVYEFLPHIPLLYLVQKAVNNLGYTFETDITDIPGYSQDYIALSKLVPDPDSFINNEKVITSGVVTGPGTGNPIPMLQTFTDTFLYDEVKPMRCSNPDATATYLYGARYTAVGPMSVQFRFNTFRVSGGTNFEQVKYRISSCDGITVTNGIGPPETRTYTGQTIVWESEDGTLINREILSDEISLGPDQMIYIEALILSGSGNYQTTIGSYFNPENNLVIPGGIINPNTGFSFKNQSELITLMGQLYGASIEVDTDNKILRAITFNTIRNSATMESATDWSTKLDLRATKKVSYTIGSYAQNNYILKKQNPVTNFEDSGYLHVENELLEGSKDLFTLSIVAADNIATTTETLSYLVAAMPMYQTDGEPATYTLGSGDNYKRAVPTLKYSEPGDILTQISIPPIVVPDSQLRYVSQFDWPIPFTTVRIRTVAEVVRMQWYMDTYYSTLINNILNRVRVVEAYFNLLPIDIQDLNMFIPVYIDYFKSYFYIQKINNYIAGELTQVNLVCLNT